MQDYKKRLLRIFIPIMLSNLIAQIQMLIDRIFLGRLDILYMSAVGNATAPVWTTMSFVFSLSMGASILISHAVGAGDRESGKDYAAAMIKFHNILPVLLFLFWMFCCPLVYTLMGVSANVLGLCVTYTRLFSPVFLLIGFGASFTVVFQTSNFTKPLATYGVIRSGLNVILDYVLIFGKFGFPRMEIAGAALATTIAEFLGAVYLVFVFCKDKRLFTRPSLKSVLHAPLMPYLKSVKIGVNAACEDFLWNIGNLLIIRILNTISDVAAGIYSMVFTIEVIAVVIIGSLGNGTLTLTGEATGAQDLPLYRKIVRTSFFWSACVSAFVVLIVSLFPSQVLGLFTTDRSVITASSLFLLLVGINLFSKSGNIIVGSGIRGYGDTRWMLCTQIAGTICVILLAALFVFTFKMGMLGVFVAVMADEFTRAVINTIRFGRIRFGSSS